MELQWLVYAFSFAVVLYITATLVKFYTSGRSGRARMATWHKGSWLKGLGIPAPTGSYEVGCVDLMHRLEGDKDGLLVRLFYPTDPGLAGHYQYVKTTPDSRYVKGMLDFMQVRLSGLITWFVKQFDGEKRFFTKE